MTLSEQDRRAMTVAGWITLYTRVKLSAIQIAERFGVSRFQVYQALREAGVERRPSGRRPKYRPDRPPIEWGGHRYTWTCKGYYRRTSEPRSLLHHDVWEAAYGPIPDGCEVWHLDGDPTNIALDNLTAVTRSAGAKLRFPLQDTGPVRRCLHCGEEMGRRWMRGGRERGWRWETPAELKQRRFCNPQCKGQYFKGRPRGFKIPSDYSQ